MSEQYTAAEVGKHKSAADGFWLIVESDVYDVTSESIPCRCRISSKSDLFRTRPQLRTQRDGTR